MRPIHDFFRNKKFQVNVYSYVASNDTDAS